MGGSPKPTVRRGYATPDRQTTMSDMRTFRNRRSVLGGTRAQRSPGREPDFSNLPPFAKMTFKIEHNVAITSRQNKKR
jgi:hypothetical protein